MRTGVMSAKGKMAVAVMLLVLLVFSSYAPLASADDEADTVDARYILYNIHIYFYDYNNHAIPITSLSIPNGGCTPVWFHVVNYSPYEFKIGMSKEVYVYSNGQKGVWKAYGWDYWNIPTGTYMEGSKYFCAFYGNVALGKGTLKWTMYGYRWLVGKPLMKSYTSKLALTIT
jgi:hypothetical protein